jgi:hypothetical protein
VVDELKFFIGLACLVIGGDSELITIIAVGIARKLDTEGPDCSFVVTTRCLGRR